VGNTLPVTSKLGDGDNIIFNGSCSVVPGTDSVVTATCHVDGRVEVTWKAFDGIELWYNCTGDVQQSVSPCEMPMLLLQ